MIATRREVPCAVCDQPVAMDSRTTAHPDAPEMLQPVDPKTWIGMVEHDDGTYELVTACSDACLIKLLADA